MIFNVLIDIFAYLKENGKKYMRQKPKFKATWIISF